MRSYIIIVDLLVEKKQSMSSFSEPVMRLERLRMDASETGGNASEKSSP